nr:hypothetical protein [Demequina litorisediminis]
MVRTGEGAVIRDAATLAAGDALHLRFAAGTADAAVTRTHA